MRTHGILTTLLAFTLGLAMPSFACAGEFERSLERAMENSRAISAARLSLRAALEELPLARQTMNMSTELSVSGASSETSTNDSDFTEANNSSLSVTLKKPLYDGGIADAELLVRQLAVERARTNLDLEEQAVLLDAIDAYVSLVVARDRVALEQANERRLQEYLKATELRINLGEATPTDLAATRAQLARAKASLITARTSLANAEETFKLKMDMPLGDLILPVIPADLPGTAGAAGDAALQNNHAHALVYLAERNERRLMDVLVANIRPKLDFSLTGKSTESNIETRVTDEVAANVTLSMPLFPNNTVRARARSRVATHRAAMLNLIDSVRNSRLAAENAYRNYDAASQVIDAYSAELEAAILLRDGTNSEVEFGLKTVLDLLDAEQDVVNARVNLLDANRSRVMAAYQLMASVGALSAETLGLAMTGPDPEALEISNPIILTPLPAIDYPE